MADKQGFLYIVATPIGNLEDMTPRAIRILQEVDCILAEDTRHSGGLLKKFAIHTQTKPYHDHNEQKVSSTIIDQLISGQSFALISDAGTPLVSDPGYQLVAKAQQAGVTVIPIPGACALINALSASGLPSDRFVFHGFLPAKAKARQVRLHELKNAQGTQIFYEAPHRLKSCIEDMQVIFGENRQACIARELTKLYETIQTNRLTELSRWLEQNPGQCRGEIVILVQGEKAVAQDENEEKRILTILLESLPPSQAVAATVKITGGKKNKLYKLAQELS